MVGTVSSPVGARAKCIAAIDRVRRVAAWCAPPDVDRRWHIRDCRGYGPAGFLSDVEKRGFRPGDDGLDHLVRFELTRLFR